MDVDEWDKKRRQKDKGEYVFVSYTREQFQTYTEEVISKWDPPNPGNEEEARIRPLLAGMRPDDLDQLYQIGFVAAQKSNVNAFWIDVLCMPPEHIARDCYRICDIARGANRVVLAVKDKVRDRLLEKPAKLEKPVNLDDLLQNWAGRLWTLPEMLLAPSAPGFDVYRATTSAVRYMETIAKRNMVERAYIKDGLLVRQLVDHFESNLHLNHIELLTIGLECLMNRGTKTYREADPIYALMTLARR